MLGVSKFNRNLVGEQHTDGRAVGRAVQGGLDAEMIAQGGQPHLMRRCCHDEENV